MFRPIFAPCGHIFQTLSIWIKLLNEEIIGPMCFLYACLFIMCTLTAVFPLDIWVIVALTGAHIVLTKIMGCRMISVVNVFIFLRLS